MSSMPVRDGMSGFFSPSPPGYICFLLQRQRGNWLPLLLAVIAIATAAVLASYRP